MENQKESMTQQNNEYVVAYGYNQKFSLTRKEAQQLVEATEQDAKIVKFGTRVLSTNYTWIAPAEQVESRDLTSKELILVEKVAEWLSRPVNGMDMTYEQALNKGKDIMRKKGYDEVYKLWRDYANGAIPSPKKFLLAAKQENI